MIKPEVVSIDPTVNVPTPNQVVLVKNVTQLYAAVNNVNNAGKTIVLKEGTYVLTRHVPLITTSESTAARGGDSNLLPDERPNQGRLELQRDMSLFGAFGSKCVLTTSPTDPPGFDVFPGARSGMIRTGRGNHTIGQLTIIAPSEAGSGISTDLPGPKFQVTTINIVRVIAGDPNSQHGTRGVDIRNTANTAIGRHLKANIELCEFHGGKQGIRIANFQGANGCKVSVEMRGNHCHDNNAGCLITNHKSSFGVIEVHSQEDRFTANGVGCTVIGSIVNGSANRTSFVATNIVSRQNTGEVDPATGHAGGIVIRGANTQQPNQASDNQVEVVFRDCKVNSNQRPGNVIAHGAHCSNPAGIAGTNNTAIISLVGGNNFTVKETDSEPQESDPKTNSVTVN